MTHTGPKTRMTYPCEECALKEVDMADLIKRVKEAEDVLWHIVNEFGFKSPSIELQRAYNEASDYFADYGTDLLESETGLEPGKDDEQK